MKQTEARRSRQKTVLENEPATAAQTETWRNGAELAAQAQADLQERALREWTGMVSRAVSPADWQRVAAGFTTIMGSLMPHTQARLEELLELVVRNNQTSAELLRKAIDAAHTPSPVQSQCKWLDFWVSSVKALEVNTVAMTQITNRALDSWIHFVRGSTAATTGVG